MRALVTGAAGFIGAHVVRALLEAGYEVRALHLPSDDLRNLRGLDCERVAGDVTDAPGLAAAMRGCDQVFHLAAVYSLWLRDPARMRAVNVEGTRNVLEAARRAGVGRVVHTSSIARFGGQGRGRRATEESPFRLGETGDLYSQTKYEAHELALAAAGVRGRSGPRPREAPERAEDGLDVVIVAPTGPIGPGDVGPTPTGRLLAACLSLPAVVVIDTAGNFADVRDIARGHVLAAQRGRRGEAYLLGHRDLALAALARMGMAALGVDRPVLVAPFSAARLAGRAAVWYAERVSGRALITPAAVAIAELGLGADCSKAVRELGLPQTPLEIAVRDAVEWFEREGYLRRRGRRTEAARKPQIPITPA